MWKFGKFVRAETGSDGNVLLKKVLISDLSLVLRNPGIQLQPWGLIDLIGHNLH